MAKKGAEDNPDNPWNRLKLAISFLALEIYQDAAICCKEALDSADFSKTPLARLWILFVLCMAKALQWLPREEILENLSALVRELDYYQFFKPDKWSDWDELSSLTNNLVSKVQNPLGNALFLLIKGELNKDVFIKNWIQ